MNLLMYQSSTKIKFAHRSKDEKLMLMGEQAYERPKARSKCDKRWYKDTMVVKLRKNLVGTCHTPSDGHLRHFGTLCTLVRTGFYYANTT